MCDTYMDVCTETSRIGTIFCTTAAGVVVVVCLLRILGVRQGDAVPSAVNRKKKITDGHDRYVPFSCVDLLAWCMLL